METLIATTAAPMTLQLVLANGDVAQADSLRSYFGKIFNAEDSGEEFPVNLEHVWRVGYGRKSDAVAALRRDFIEGADFQVLRQLPQNPEGGRPAENYTLTVSCMEYLAVRVNRAVFEVYRACRQVVRRALLPNFSDPAAAARAWASEFEEKQKALAIAQQAQQQLVEAKPKIEFFDKVAISTNALSFEDAAKWLKIPGLEGRNKLIKRLKEDKILQKNRSPYQRYIDENYFEVEAQTYQAGEKGKRLASTTRVTPKGLDWLLKKYKA